MGFRDETQALRSRIEILEAELDDAREQVERMRASHEEAEHLRERVAELEAQLHGLEKKTAPARAKVARNVRRAALAAAAVALAGFGFYWMTDGGVDADATPRHGAIDLDTIDSRHTLQVNARGDHELVGCPGHVPSQPAVALRASEARSVQLWTESPSDTVLYVRTADGQTLCDDDSGDGFNARLELTLPEGESLVWVGTYASGGSANATLVVFDPSAPDATIAVDADPSLRTLTIDGGGQHRVSGTTVGALPAHGVDPQCPGSVPAQPHLTLDVREPIHGSLTASSEADLVLLVRRPDGTFACDDDSGSNLDPRVDEPFAPGTYRVWVGTYRADRSAEFDLSFTADTGPPPSDPDAPPRLGRWDLGAQSLLSFSDRVDGGSPVSSTQPQCRTLYGSSAPDLELSLAVAQTVTLSLTSDAWLGMLVEHPDGTQSCGASVDSRPAVWSAGSHRVWVGAPEPGAGTRFTLVAQTQAPQ